MRITCVGLLLLIGCGANHAATAPSSTGAPEANATRSAEATNELRLDQPVAFNLQPMEPGGLPFAEQAQQDLIANHQVARWTFTVTEPRKYIFEAQLDDSNEVVAIDVQGDGVSFSRNEGRAQLEIEPRVGAQLRVFVSSWNGGAITGTLRVTAAPVATPEERAARIRPQIESFRDRYLADAMPSFGNCAFDVVDAWIEIATEGHLNAWMLSGGSNASILGTRHGSVSGNIGGPGSTALCGLLGEYRSTLSDVPDALAPLAPGEMRVFVGIGEDLKTKTVRLDAQGRARPVWLSPAIALLRAISSEVESARAVLPEIEDHSTPTDAYGQIRTAMLYPLPERGENRTQLEGLRAVIVEASNADGYSMNAIFADEQALLASTSMGNGQTRGQVDTARTRAAFHAAAEINRMRQVAQHTYFPAPAAGFVKIYFVAGERVRSIDVPRTQIGPRSAYARLLTAMGIEL